MLPTQLLLPWLYSIRGASAIRLNHFLGDDSLERILNRLSQIWKALRIEPGSEGESSRKQGPSSG